MSIPEETRSDRQPAASRTAASRLRIGGIVVALWLLAIVVGGAAGTAWTTVAARPSGVASRVKAELGHARVGDLLIHLVVLCSIGSLVMTYRLIGFHTIKRFLSESSTEGTDTPARPFGPERAAKGTLHFDGYCARRREEREETAR